MVFVIGIVVLGTAIWGLSNPFVGLLGLLVLNMTQPGEIYPIFNSLHVERVMALVVLLSFLSKHRKFEFPPISKKLLYFWLVMFLAVPLAFWPSFALSSTLDFGKVILFHLLIVNLLRTEDQFRRYLLVHAGIIGWFAGSSFYQHAQGVVTYAFDPDRAAGITSSVGDPNTLGLSLVAALPLVVLVMGRDFSKPVRLAALAVACLSVWTVVITNSRTSFFCMLFVGVLYTLTRKKGFFLIPIAAMVGMVGWSVLPQQYKERYQSVENLQKDESYQNRVRAWRAGWAMFKDNPLTGVGMRNFTYANGGKYWPGPGRAIWLNAHSLYFQLPAELGLLGVFTFGSFMAAVFGANRALRKASKEDPAVPASVCAFPLACTLTLLTLLLGGYSSHNLYRSNWYMLGGMTAALHEISRRKVATETAAISEKEPSPVLPETAIG